MKYYAYKNEEEIVSVIRIPDSKKDYLKTYDEIMKDEASERIEITEEEFNSFE